MTTLGPLRARCQLAQRLWMPSAGRSTGRSPLSARAAPLDAAGGALHWQRDILRVTMFPGQPAGSEPTATSSPTESESPSGSAGAKSLGHLGQSQAISQSQLPLF